MLCQCVGTQFCTKTVSSLRCPLTQPSVRLELENCRFTTTQDMFLEKVGITNSFNDDNEFRFKPFFVSYFHPLIRGLKEVNGIQFAHIKKKELYFVTTSLNRTMSPSLALELLDSIINVSLCCMLMRCVANSRFLWRHRRRAAQDELRVDLRADGRNP